MAFEVRSIFSLIVSKNLKHIKCFSALLPERSDSKQPHHILPKRFSYPAKPLICLLCLNVLWLNSHHVICLELITEGIRKAHLQSHHCQNPENHESGTFFHSHNSRTSHAVPLHLESKTQSCPECIDQHIQSINSSPETNLFASSLFENISPIIPRKINQLLYALVNSYVPIKYNFPLASFRSSVIRSTIMLI